jgi:hypothetical protein
MASARPKHTELFESEGRILRLEFDPEAPPESMAANLRIFAEVAAIGLDAADVERVREALAKRATKGGQ